MADTLIKPYSSVPYLPLNDVELESRHGAQFFSNVKQLSVGFGSRVFRIDRDGMWAGAETFASAPWSVDWDGNMIANSVSLTGFLEVGDALNDIGVGNITNTYIGSNAISAAKIQSNAVTASKINVSELSAITADIGSITSGTVTGALIRTSSSGDRVEINDSTDSIRIYNGSDLRIEIVEDRITFQDSSEDDTGSIYASSSGNLLVAATGTNSDLLLSSSTGDVLISSLTDDITITAADRLNLNTTAISDDVYIGLGGNTFMQFGDARVYMDVFIDMEGNDITDGGDFTCVSLTETSDIRLKKNIKPIKYGLTELLQLNPIQYQFKKQVKKTNDERRRKKSMAADVAKLKEKTQQKHLGFSAQDVFKIMPELTKNADGKSQKTARFYSTQMIPVLVQSIKELHQQVSDLADEVKTLRGG